MPRRLSIDISPELFDSLFLHFMCVLGSRQVLAIVRVDIRVLNASFV